VAQKKGRRKASSEKTRGTAPSSANLDSLEKFEASEEAQAHEPSDVDAMGQNKRRAVVGHAYGPSKKSQILFFAAVGAVFLVLIGGSLLAVAAFDKAPDSYPDEAPWSEADAEQISTRDPSGPCGEPGNAYPFPADSACATGTNSEGEPAAPSADQSSASGDRAPGSEQASGGVTESGNSNPPGG
jgi:hypothetical protein